MPVCRMLHGKIGFILVLILRKSIPEERTNMVVPEIRSILSKI
jgi:hypothetical protein